MKFEIDWIERKDCGLIDIVCDCGEIFTHNKKGIEPNYFALSEGDIIQCKKCSSKYKLESMVEFKKVLEMHNGS